MEENKVRIPPPPAALRKKAEQPVEKKESVEQDVMPEIQDAVPEIQGTDSATDESVMDEQAGQFDWTDFVRQPEETVVEPVLEQKLKEESEEAPKEKPFKKKNKTNGRAIMFCVLGLVLSVVAIGLLIYFLLQE